MTVDPFEYDVALSFARQERPAAEELARLLTGRNIKVFLDEYTGAEPWGRDVLDHLVNLYARKARYCVLFLSQHYPLEKWTEAERASAQQRALRDAGEHILPLRLDESGIPVMAGGQDSDPPSMERLAHLLEEKVTKARRPGPPAKSHDLRSGNVPSTDR